MAKKTLQLGRNPLKERERKKRKENLPLLSYTLTPTVKR